MADSFRPNPGAPSYADLASLNLRLQSRCFNLASALDMATATLELHLPCGARSQPFGWPRRENGDVNERKVADMARALLAEVRS